MYFPKKSIYFSVPVFLLKYMQRILIIICDRDYFVLRLNSKIPEYYKTMLRLEGGQNYEYMSGFMESICNPFNGAPNYSYVPGNCPKNSIPIGHLPNVSY